MRSDMDELKEYETPNIVLAATLLCHGSHISNIKLTGRNNTMGIFALTDVTQTRLMEFDQGRLLVDPTIFNMHVRRLTSMVKGVIKND